MRMAPPGRASNSQTGFVNPCGPHHCATRFGSVHILKTSSRGASTMRVRTNSCSSFVMKFSVGMLFPLFLNVTQIVIQTIKALGPEPLIERHPIGDVLEGRCSDPAGPPLRLAPACDQTSVFQHFEVPRDGGHV